LTFCLFKVCFCGGNSNDFAILALMLEQKTLVIVNKYLCFFFLNTKTKQALAEELLMRRTKRRGE